MMGKQEVPQLKVVQEARDSLRYCATSEERYLGQYFAIAFNHWYSPAVRRGYTGSMATVFDLGIMLVQSPIVLRKTLVEGPGHEEYLKFMRVLAESPMMQRACRLWSEAPDDFSRRQVEWILMESLLRVFPSCWKSPNDQNAVRQPFVRPTSDRKKLSVHLSASEKASLGEVILDESKPVDKGHAYPSPLAGWDMTELPGSVRLFMAHTASRSPDAVDRLDYEVVEACLVGPNLRPLNHEPPRSKRIQIEWRSLSQIPGRIGGVTRAEVKQPEDSILDVLPSELALFKVNELAGYDHWLNRKPLVNKHENQYDIVPRHRALVCFLVAAGTGTNPRRAGEGINEYRDSYVYAKRQVFDLLRDLREASDRVKHPQSLDIDVAVFAMQEGRQDAAVHRCFGLRRLASAQTGNEHLDRLDQMMSFTTLVPEFCERLMQDRRASVGSESRVNVETIAKSDVGQFLRHKLRDPKPYFMVHLVVIGSPVELARFVDAASRHHSFEVGVLQRFTLISVDTSRLDSDQRLITTREPSWGYAHARTLKEAMGLSGPRVQQPTTLATLRRKFVVSVVGPLQK